jgi:hypothetical protein
MESKKEIRSAIYGTGYGMNHMWRDLGSAQVYPNDFITKKEYFAAKGTKYICLECGITFIHRYGLIYDIFENMKSDKIPEICNKK